MILLKKRSDSNVFIRLLPPPVDSDDWDSVIQLRIGYYSNDKYGNFYGYSKSWSTSAVTAGSVSPTILFGLPISNLMSVIDDELSLQVSNGKLNGNLLCKIGSLQSQASGSSIYSFEIPGVGPYLMQNVGSTILVKFKLIDA